MALRFAVVGSGPSGFYMSKHLLDLQAHVDMYERLPSPFGLIRYGVPPDRPHMKSVQEDYSQLTDYERFRFFGNVEVGKQVSHSDLLDKYSGVIYANGTWGYKTLDMPGEEHVFSAQEVVQWYNSYPLENKFSIEGAKKIGIIGNGCVAVDIARILCSPVERLINTDVSSKALEAIQNSQIEEVHLYARRGFYNAAFDSKELTALKSFDVSMTNWRDSIPTKPWKPVDGTQTINEVNRLVKLAEHFESEVTNPKILFRFLLNPKSYDGRTLTLEKTKVVDDVAVPTGDIIEEDLDILISSIGFQAQQIPGLPYDNGKIESTSSKVMDRVYVSGWAESGP